MGILNLYSERIEIEKLPKKMVEPNSFSFITNSDCSRLQELLEAGKWEEADNETLAIMLRATKREQKGWLDLEHLQQFSDSDLNTINQLWVNYSNGHFGFSVQKSLWQHNSHNFIWEVGWSKEVSWTNGAQGKFYSQAIFDITAPQGHLPRCILINSLKINFLNGNYSKYGSWSWGNASGIWQPKGNTKDNAYYFFVKAHIHDNWQKDLECILSRQYLDKIPRQMKHQEIFEKVRNIVAKELEVNQEEINLEYELFMWDMYDKRLLWGSTGYSSVSDFNVEDAEYYEYRIITATYGDGSGVEEIIWELEEEFDIEITDKVAGDLRTVGEAVNYISNIINSAFSE